MAYDGAGEQTTEVSANEGLSGHCGAEGSGRRLAETFVDEEEKGFFGLLIDTGNVYGAADRASKLVTVEAGARQAIAVVEVVVSIECAVAIELEHVSMEAVGARLGDDVDDVTAAPAILRGESIGLDLELLDVFDGGNIDNAAPVLRGVPGAIEEIGSGAEVCSTEVQEGDVLVGAAGDTVGVNHLGLRRVVD